MPREAHPFEQDFVLVGEQGSTVKQATQNPILHASFTSRPGGDLWEWDTNGSGSDELGDAQLDEDYATIWETMLERI